MAIIHIPSLMLDLTSGVSVVEVNAVSVRQALDLLEERFPGFKERLCEGDLLRPNFALVVDGAISPRRLKHRITEKSDVRFIPALAGG